jgi:hypothetical protein
MTTNTGSPAFPTNNYTAIAPMSTGYSEGMTLRDYFAAKAMQGILAHGYTRHIRVEDLYACDAYVIADAMLKTRELAMLKAREQK